MERSYTIQILLDGIIDDDLYLRPLSIEREGQSDYISESSVYSGSPMNFMKWLPAKYLLGKVWKGRLISELEKFSHTPHGSQTIQPQKYEYAKGNIPKSHIHEYTTTPWHG